MSAMSAAALILEMEPDKDGRVSMNDIQTILFAERAAALGLTYWRRTSNGEYLREDGWTMKAINGKVFVHSPDKRMAEWAFEGNASLVTGFQRPEMVMRFIRAIELIAPRISRMDLLWADEDDEPELVVA